MWKRNSLWLWHARNGVIRKAVTFAVYLSGLPALPGFHSTQKEILSPLDTHQDLRADRLLPGVLVENSGEARLLLKFQRGKTGCSDLDFKVEVPDTADRNLREKADALAMKLKASLVELGEIVFLDVQPKAVPVGATTENFDLDPPTGVHHKNPSASRLFHIGSLLDDDESGLFLSLAPAPRQGGPGQQPEYKLRLTPAHWIGRAWIDEKELQMSIFDPDGDVATLPTRELQKVFLKYADDAEGFDSVDEFKRKDGGSR